MKISESAVAMQSTHSYSKYQETQVRSVLVRPAVFNAVKKDNEGVDVSISGKSQSLLEQFQAKQEEMQKSRQAKAEGMVQQTNESENVGNAEPADAKDDQMLKTLRRVLSMLRKMKKGSVWSMGDLEDQIDKKITETESRTNRQLSMSSAFSMTSSSSATVVDLRSSAAISAGNGTKWIRHTEKSGFMMEQESTSFSANGLVRTADGREIEFGVDFSMSRGFAGQFFESSDVETIMTDPLVINLDQNVASVKDQKFYFDLDSDGEKEEISELGSGSGFLAYDKNGDGVINDGSELFGTKSGDGFKDLSAYDKDGNGWIDENDEIFSKLKVWTKDENGKDKLLSLKEADVGAIYLGNADTQMHLNEATTNQTNAMIQKTGVFLKESGGVGTVQHLDLAI